MCDVTLQAVEQYIDAHLVCMYSEVLVFVEVFLILGKDDFPSVFAFSFAIHKMR